MTSPSPMEKLPGALLSQPSFIKSHLNRLTYTSDEVLLIFSDDENPLDDNTPFTTHSSQSPHIELHNFIKSPLFNYPPDPRYTTVIGSVNGLVCIFLTTYGFFDPIYVVHIWNPSLSAMLTLPSFSMPPLGDLWNDIVFRFGYDPKTDDYKVVALVGSHEPNPGGTVVKEWPQVGIYSMRKGTWEVICESVPSHITMIYESDEVCLDGHDGHLHWLCFIDKELRLQTILAFDLGVETFSEIPLPPLPQVNNNLCRWNILGVLSGKICLMTSIEGSGCEVWVMEEYGVADSWVKRHHVLSQCKDLIEPVGFTPRNQFLFVNEDVLSVLYMHSNTTQMNVVKVMPSDKRRERIKVVVHVDSLVWVAPTKNVSAASASVLCKHLKKALVLDK